MSLESDPLIELMFDQRTIDFMKEEDESMIKVETPIPSENDYVQSPCDQIQNQ